MPALLQCLGAGIGNVRGEVASTRAGLSKLPVDLLNVPVGTGNPAIEVPQAPAEVLNAPAEVWNLPADLRYVAVDGANVGIDVLRVDADVVNRPAGAGSGDHPHPDLTAPFPNPEPTRCTSCFFQHVRNDEPPSRVLACFGEGDFLVDAHLHHRDGETSHRALSAASDGGPVFDRKEGLAVAHKLSSYA